MPKINQLSMLALNVLPLTSRIKTVKIGRAEVRKSGKAKDCSSHLS
jgi:hypothetical protein